VIETQTLVPRNYTPHTAQKGFHRRVRDARFVAANSGRRGGKTKGGGGEFARRVARDLRRKQALGLAWVRGEGKDPDPFLRYAVVAPTYALLDEPRIALQNYFGRVESGGLIVSQTDTTWWLVCGIRIDFRSGDRPERLVSHGYNGLWAEESARLKASVWTDNLRPALSDKNGWAIFTTTPLGKNWFWEHVWCKGDPAAAAELARLRSCEPEEILDPEFVCVSWTTADNDALPHLAEEMQVAKRQMSDALWRRNYLASFDAFEGQLFDLETRQFQKWKRGTRLRAFAGIDLGNVGKTSHRTSFSIVVEPRPRDWHEARTESGTDLLPFGDDAWRAREKGDRSTWANRLWAALCDVVGADAWRTVPVFVPADRPDVKRVFKEYGFKVAEAYQEHEPAVTWVQVALKNDRLLVSSEVLWNCLVGIRYPEAGRASTKLWVNENDDEWDALRYALSDVIRKGEAPTRAPLSVMGWNRV